LEEFTVIEVPYKCNDNTCAANALIKTPKYGILKRIMTDMFLLLVHKKLGFQSLVLNVWNVRSPPPPPPPPKTKTKKNKKHYYTKPKKNKNMINVLGVDT